MAGPPSPQLHFFLPPNLTSAWDRDAVPLRLEIPPAARPAEAPLADLPEKQRAAAFVLQQWCGGKLAPFLQLNREQLETLQGLLAAEPCFFILPDRSTPALWAGDRLALLPSASSDAPPETPPPSQLPPAPNGNSRPAPRECPGPEVEGSEHYLAIRLPSREHPAYREIADLLRSEGFKLEPSNRRWWLRDRHKTLGFLGRFWRKLEQQWTAVFTPNFRRRTAHLSFAAPGCQVRSSDLDTKGGWEVDITLSAPGLDPRALQESLVQGRHWVQSGEGVILIDPADLARVEAGRRALDGNPEAGPALRSRHLVNRERLHDIEDILEEVSPGFRPPTEWAEQTRALRELSSLPAPTLPADLTAALRPYQHLGAAWLRHLHREGLGGILADEMGLGKTVQALALLASLQCDPPPGPPRPSLVVCPASLVENWRREAARFAPSLRVFIHRGNRRLEATADASAYDLVITSYGTLVRDREFFARLRFACLFADEAQHAKNRRTLNARSLRSLAADGRFLLTGTPVENSLEDLRSLIDIILPGAWSGPAAAAPGEDTSWRDERLRRLAAPYLLRRTKAAVAAELPPRIEQVLYCEMEDSQRDLYESLRAEAHSELRRLSPDAPADPAARLRAFTRLLRLRQICCHPALLGERHHSIPSGKIAAFRELLSEILDDGHRVLVFSQFVSLLKLLEPLLDDLGAGYERLDGSTRDRQAVCDRFNDPAGPPVLLVSLRAGGVGLNLTGADTVIHFDPWWNPAVEAQATDRAHRIGQTRTVTSIKLITAASVEEKVLLMQQEKRRHLEAVFEAGEAARSPLTLEDLGDLFSPDPSP